MLWLGISVGATSLFAQAISPKGIEHVVVIGIDGLSSEGLQKANTPFIDQLIAEGTVSWKARTVLPTVSSPNWASIIHGAGPEQHGISSNDWVFGEGIVPVVKGENGRFPSVFDVIKAQEPKAIQGAVYQWDGFANMYDQQTCVLNKNLSTPDATTAVFTRFIQQQKPRFAFIQLDHVDGAGHEEGHMTDGYLKAITHADVLIGQIVKAIAQAGLTDKTLILIVADHGGIGKGHGGETLEELTVPVVLAGKGVKKNYELKQQVYNYDIASTVLYAFGMPQPYAWIGRPILAAFEGEEEPSNLWLGKQHIERPTILPAKVLNQQAGGMYINKNALVDIKSKENSIIRYTVDGTEPSASSTIFTKAFTVDRSTVVRAKAFSRDGLQESVIADAYYRLTRSDNQGLTVSYFPAEEQWLKLPDFSNMKVKDQWKSFEFHIDNEKITDLSPKRGCFGLVFEGSITIDHPGEYTFYTQSDDGSKLYIDGKLVVDNDGDHGVVERKGSVKLAAGHFPIRITYFNVGGGYWLEAFYSGPKVAKQIIPVDKLQGK